MARVTFINAILSGKLAGTVYARNKAGQYIKQWTKPTDPMSVAQMTNRALFSTCSGQWHSLTDYFKGLWNSFGSTLYIAKGSTGVSTMSGFNAFVGLRNSVEVATRQTRVTTVTTPATTTNVDGVFSNIDTPPTVAMSGAIQTAAGLPLPILLTGATIVGATYEVTANFFLNGIAPGLPKFLDAISSKPVGIMLQMSIPQVQIAGFVQGKNIQTIGVWAPTTLTNATWAGQQLNIEMAGSDSHMADYKTQVQTGQIVQISAYLISENGEQRPIGTVKTTVL
jgi:hypothetical protein